jgi:hypothetical protein
MDNPETMATFGIQDTGPRQTKEIPQHRKRDRDRLLATFVLKPVVYVRSIYIYLNAICLWLMFCTIMFIRFNIYIFLKRRRHKLNDKDICSIIVIFY